jgi:hypothetical protein
MSVVLRSCIFFFFFLFCNFYFISKPKKYVLLSKDNTEGGKNKIKLLNKITIADPENKNSFMHLLDFFDINRPCGYCLLH